MCTYWSQYGGELGGEEERGQANEAVQGSVVQINEHEAAERRKTEGRRASEEASRAHLDFLSEGFKGFRSFKAGRTMAKDQSALA